MKNIKPFGPSIGRTKISNRFFAILNKEFDSKSKTKKIDYSTKLASQIKNELKISNKFIKQHFDKEVADAFLTLVQVHTKQIYGVFVYYI